MLSDEAKAKEQLTGELVVLRQRVAELETLETERKRMEEALRKSEGKLDAMLQSIGDHMSMMDKDLNIIWANKTAKRIFGNDIIGKKCYEVYHKRKEPCKPYPCLTLKAFQDGKVHEHDTQVIDKDGEIVYFHCTASVALRDKDGEPTAVIEISRDITERKQAEEALKESEHKYRALFESTLDGAFVIDAGTMKVVLANEAAAKIYGFDSVDDAVGASLLDFVPPEDRERVIRIIAEDMFEKDLRQVNEFRTITKDGREIWISAIGVRTEYQGRLAGLVSIRDITERKRAEEALKEAEERYHAIFEQAADSIVLVDAETGALVEFNDRAYQNLGYSRKEFQKLKISDFEVIESAEEVAKRIEKIIKQGSDVFETQHRTKGGEIRDIQVSARAICIGGRDFIQGIWRDITPRKRAEEALRESEERYSALLNLGGEVGEAIVMLQDTEQGDAIQTFVTNEWPHITGYSRKELLGMSFFDLLHPKYREASLKRHKRKMSGEIIPGLFEMSIITKDGTEVPIEVTSAYTIYQGQRANVAFIRDITERKQAEEREKELQQQLYLSSRLAAIGELAAGVAHEISNPLTGILGFSQRLMRKSTDEEVSRDLERIHSEAQRVAKVVGNLLTFARRREPRKEYSDINDILQQALELRAYELKTSDIEVVTSLAPSLPETMADFHQIQEVFLNIILNAEQAMSEANSGGKLSVKTQPTRDYIRISFADDGPGIPAEQLDKIFDPFFTTRGEKGGTGLGLSLCHGIVTEHAGRIYAKSKPGKGATFFVELPLSPVGASFADIY